MACGAGQGGASVDPLLVVLRSAEGLRNLKRGTRIPSETLTRSRPPNKTQPGRRRRRGWGSRPPHLYTGAVRREELGGDRSGGRAPRGRNGREFSGERRGGAGEGGEWAVSGGKV
jgi:hypothetical protein